MDSMKFYRLLYQANPKTKLEDMELRVRTNHCLNAANLKTIADLQAFCLEDGASALLRLPNFGRLSLVDIGEALEFRNGVAEAVEKRDMGLIRDAVRDVVREEMLGILGGRQGASFDDLI